MSEVTDRDNEAAAIAVGFASLPEAWNEALLFGDSKRVARLKELAPHFARHSEQAVQEAVAPLNARIAELEGERRNLVSHATGGQHTGEGMSLNDVCVAISAFRNVLYEDGKERGRAAALQEIDNAQS